VVGEVVGEGHQANSTSRFVYSAMNELCGIVCLIAATQSGIVGDGIKQPSTGRVDPWTTPSIVPDFPQA
jgi:hypothetical protein